MKTCEPGTRLTSSASFYSVRTTTQRSHCTSEQQVCPRTNHTVYQQLCCLYAVHCSVWRPSNLPFALRARPKIHQAGSRGEHQLLAKSGCIWDTLSSQRSQFDSRSSYRTCADMATVVDLRTLQNKQYITSGPPCWSPFSVVAVLITDLLFLWLARDLKMIIVNAAYFHV